jgi:hypothetical protein
MITEGKNYEENLVKMNPILTKLNRYKDILPCNFILFFMREMNLIGLMFLDKLIKIKMIRRKRKKKSLLILIQILIRIIIST